MLILEIGQLKLINIPENKNNVIFASAIIAWSRSLTE